MNNLIIWFPKEPANNALELHISKEGILSFDDGALELLPRYIMFGFDTRTRQLYLKKASKQEGVFTLSFPRKLPQFTSFLKENHIQFPVFYQMFQKDKKELLWIGNEYKEDRLSPMEMDIFDLTLKGYSQSEILKKHNISKTQYSFILDKIIALYYKE